MTVLERLVHRTGEKNEKLLVDIIETAKNAILSRRYPYGDYPTRTVTTEWNGEETTTEETYVEDKYLDLQFRIARDLYNKIGGEGELRHAENGITREWESSWVSQQLLLEVVPKYSGVK